MYMLNNNNQWNRIGSWLSFCVVTFLLSACSEVSDSLSDSTSTSVSSKDAVAFSANVSSSKQATRADATIVNKGETMLLPTIDSNRKVGIFGAYTGKYTWAELVTLSKTEFADRNNLTRYTELTELSTLDNEEAFNEKKEEILNKHYSASQMFNIPATINKDGTLTYLPLQFWPNNTLPSSTEHEYMTFWAYYPYNESSTLGEFGISMTNDENGVGAGMGMGKVKFTMHADAAQHNDFLISSPVTDCNRDKYPLLRTENPATYDPKPVQFRLYHMLAQVRFYTFIYGNDKMVYKDTNGDGTPDAATQADLDDLDDVAIAKKYFRKADETNDGVATGMWLENGFVINGVTIDADYITAHGEELSAVMNEQGCWIPLNIGDKIPDESKCVRWKRSNVWNLSHTSQRPEMTYTMQMNNIRTTATFYPHYYYPLSDAVSIDIEEASTLGSVTVNNYIMNPYWFTFQNGQRVRLNDNYMFDYYEDTPVAKSLDATGSMVDYDDIDGVNWEGMDSDPLPDPLDYFKSDHDKEEALETLDQGQGHKHYNYAPGNIMMVVPQTLSDEDVPHVIITAHCKTYTNGDPAILSDGTAKVTINLLKMGISWENGFIYCYAFLDDLKPGDDKVRGPESITVLFNKHWYTDQW